jgi:hypothetical protein
MLWSWQWERYHVFHGKTVPTEECALLMSALEEHPDLRDTLTREQTRGLDLSPKQDSSSESAAVDPLLIETQLVVRVAEVAEAVRAARPSSGAMRLVRR